MKIKVCGITDLYQMQQLQQLGVDYAGMIFYRKSKRYAGDAMKSDMSAIKNLALDRVGVFVNESQEGVEKLIDDYGLSAVQLHGDESPEFCAALMHRTKVIKVFRLKGDENIDEMVAPFQHVCHYFLFDTGTEQYGGSGKKFNWEVLKEAAIKKPFFLSGGIGLSDLDMLREFHHPWLYAVDINSRFETEPGKKNMSMVEAFYKALI